METTDVLRPSLRAKLQKHLEKNKPRAKPYNTHMAEWLDTIDFDYFCTFTTGYELTLPSARRIMRRYFDKVVNLGVRPQMFWVAEAHECKDGYHTHALLKVSAPDEIKPMVKQYLWELWQAVSVYSGQSTKRTDGKVYNRCDIQKRNPKLKGSCYLSKYVTKRRADYDILFA